MEFRSFLIKYGEIGVKGKNRWKFEDVLIRQVKTALRKVDGTFDIVRQHGRIYVDTDGSADYEDTIEALKHVFGLVSICPVVRFENRDYEFVKEQVVRYMKEVYGTQQKTFKVFTRRIDKDYPGTSETISAELGAVILDACPNLTVNVREPEIPLHVEIRNEAVSIYSLTIPGPGGMPVGTNGRAMLLLSGGIDSPVAGYMIAKRGVLIEATYFHAPPYTSDRAKQKVIDLAKLVAKYAGPVNLHIINFTEIQLAIYEKCPHEELTIIMRRYMMRIAEEMAKKTGAMALITGESIGQVASQTVDSLVCTNDVCTLPVFRPLIGFDKQEIVERSEQIGTYETSIEPYEDCCTIFVAKHPVTHPDLERIRESEKKLADVIDEMVARAVETQERILCTAD
ncbi:MAG: tRNA 4-thiouridine(8) synthase ThiI [Stomatobaculum sp.]|nr:tRNA 4-thiouridine(8) synthase ThiI [Stomatobaculum sp.]